MRGGAITHPGSEKLPGLLGSANTNPLLATLRIISENMRCAIAARSACLTAGRTGLVDQGATATPEGHPEFGASGQAVVAGVPRGAGPVVLLGDHRRIRLTDTHPEHAPGQPLNQAWRLPGLLLCRQTLPDDDNHHGGHDESRSTDGKDQQGGPQRSAPLLIVRSTNEAAKYAPAKDLPVSTAPHGAPKRGSSPAGVAAPDQANEGLAVSPASAAAVRLQAQRRAGRCPRPRPSPGLHCRKRHKQLCPILGAEWERRAAVRRCQKGSPYPAGLL